MLTCMRSPDGGATNKAPKAGFDGADLSVYFTRVYTAATTRTATRSIPTTTATSTSKPVQKKKSSSGAIIGGAVGGGVVVLLIIGALVWCCLGRRNRNNPHQPVPQQGIPSQQQHYHQNAYAVYPNTPPVQLATNEHAPIAELQGAEVGAAGLGHKSWGSVSPGEKAPQYSYFPHGSSHPSSPSQSPPPAHSPIPATYFPPPGAPNVPPVYYQQPQGYAQPHPQQYPSPASPPQQQYYQPPGHAQQYSPPSQVSYPTPTSTQSPNQGFTPSPLTPIPRRALPPQ
jgi:hypothetical protein